MYTFLDFFSGIGGFRLGMEQAGHKCLGHCEIDKYANKSYTAMHNPSETEWFAEDITKVNPEDVPDADVYCFGFPCFAAGTLITTDKGMVPIEDIRAGDMVLTHKDRFKKVITPMINRKKGIYKLKVYGSPETYVTGNHRFYVVDKERYRDNKGARRYRYSEPYWKAVENFTGNEMIKFPKFESTKSNPLNITEDEAYFLGVYTVYGDISSIGTIRLNITDDKFEKVRNRLPQIDVRYANPNNNNTKVVRKKWMQDSIKVSNICRLIGTGKLNKRIPPEILNLPEDILKEFLDGVLLRAYINTNNSNTYHVFSSVNKVLIYQIAELFHNVHDIGYSIIFRPLVKLDTEDRYKNNSYAIFFKLVGKHRKFDYTIIDGHLFQSVQDVKYLDKEMIVYNMEVEEDNSYVANNLAAHNCQAFSIAGKRGGFTDTRGTLFFDVMRIAKERKPKILFAENVKGLLSHDKGRTFGTIIRTMDELGYDVEWQVLNSVNFGVPQNRERVFIDGHRRGAGGRKAFPITENSETADELYKQSTNTIRARYGEAASHGSFIVESQQPSQIKQIVGGSQGQRIYDPSGVSVTLKGLSGRLGGKTGLYAIPVNSPEIINKSQNGRRFKESDDPMFTLTGQDRHGVMIYQRPRGNNDGGIHDISPTISSNSFQKNNCLINGCRIRKLTPKECFRLQGFPDECYERASSVNSDSQIYKQIGNSVTVNVIYEIAKRL